MPLLAPGSAFPSLTISPVDGPPLQLPGDLTGHWAVVLLYRGHWCPFCRAQLTAFQRAGDELAELDVRVVGLSVEDEATTRTLITEHGISFPVGHDADAAQVAERTGAFVNPDPVFLQSTGFVLDPTGSVVVSVYSSGAIGRLVPEDVIGLVRHKQQQAA